jgi:predicted XRE-type DNA-binding protein
MSARSATVGATPGVDTTGIAHEMAALCRTGNPVQRAVPGGDPAAPRCGRCGRRSGGSALRDLGDAEGGRTGRRQHYSGTGIVFADLGFPVAAERQARLRLAYALNQLLAERKLSQADAAKVLGVTQPKVSALRHYKLAGFSVERLMNLLTALDQDVEIVIRREPRSRKVGRITVVAA